MRDTLDELWPAGVHSTRSGMLVVLPTRRRPRLLVPKHSRRAAASAIMRYTAQQNIKARARSAALACGVMLGGNLLKRPARGSLSDPRSESIQDYLTQVLGTPVVTSLALTPARANRKPVLHVSDTHGRTLAFAKVGTNPLTHALVNAEAAALRQLESHGSLTEVDIPRVLHHGPWGHLVVLVTSPLSIGPPVKRMSYRLDEAMQPVCEASTSGSIDADYFPRLHAQVSALQDDDRQTAILASHWLTAFNSAAGHLPVAKLDAGAWHGDWTAWNCAIQRGRIKVWDWERYNTCVPRGFDKLHYHFNDMLNRQRHNLSVAAEQLIKDASNLLSGWVRDPRAAYTTAVFYLLDIALRYMTDDPMGAHGYARINEWALPVVERAIERVRRHSAT